MCQFINSHSDDNLNTLINYNLQLIMNKYSMKTLPSGFYVYAYMRQSGSPYYIGKGKGKRAFQPHKSHNPPADLSRIVILESNLSEIGALALERRYIRWYGRKDNNTGILINLTDGGEGFSGLKKTPEHKQKIGLANKGKTPSPEQIRHQSEIMKGRIPHNKGKPMSDEQKLKLSKALKGKPNLGLRGRVFSDEHKKKLSDAKKRKIS